MRRLLPLLMIAFLVAFLPSCTSSPQGDPPEGPGTEGADREWKSELGKSDELAGSKVVESTDGPWEIRKTGGRGSSSPSAHSPTASPATPGSPAEPDLELADSASGDEPGGAVGWEGEAEMLDLASESARTVRVGGGAKGADGVERTLDMVPPTTRVPESRYRAELSREAAPVASATAVPMRASLTDDNEDYDKFLDFIAGWSDRSDVAERIDYLDVSGRKYLRVVNAEGEPVPGAKVLLVDETADRILQAGTTYGDGRVPYYPNVVRHEEPAASLSQARSLLVEVTFGDVRQLSRWDGSGEEFVIEIDAKDPVGEPIALDVLFLIDTTGSMGDEIQRVKATLLQVTQKLRKIEREFELRYAAVLYRDVGDEYVTKSHPFTADIEAFDEALRSVVANGGGDGPESLNQGLAEAVGRDDWREGAAKLVFLIADAPPHMDYAGDIRYPASLRAAVERGIRVHSVAASGLDATGSFVFRQIAQYARGKFIFVEYGTREESAASHGVAGKTKSNNLDDIIFEQIKEEVATWGRA